ncbi:hypothetical protein [Nocardioides sp. TF02-7]|uniref:hypothetical protein n=1 Tax=Nocardioides sp. TF02-7 TaxID=2917724 RepID=UPI001F058C4B|nr:hypothetical protein [Nocardioides sp. TF02-7]UMG93693.1 hypothetical protein MF408_05800 [Nocardioides sp. TF02-7]
MRHDRRPPAGRRRRAAAGEDRRGRGPGGLRRRHLGLAPHPLRRGVRGRERLPAPIVDGQVYGAWFVQMLQDWLGPRCFVRTLEFSFRNLMFVGETLRCEGRVVEAPEDEVDEVTVELTATVVGRDGAPDRVAAAPARAVVLLGRADGPAA